MKKAVWNTHDIYEINSFWFKAVSGQDARNDWQSLFDKNPVIKVSLQFW